MSNRRLLLALAAAAIFLFGIVMALLGAILLPLSQRLQIGSARAGDLFLSMNFGIFLALAASGAALDRWGIRPVLIACSLLLGGGLWGLASATSIAQVAASAFAIGLAGGGLNTGANTLVSDAYAEDRGQALNLLGMFFGFGAVLLPFAVGIVTAAWTLFLYVAGVLAVVCAVACTLIPFPPAHEAHSFSIREAASVLKNPLVLLFAAILFCQSGNEFTMGGWISSYLSREVGASAQAATLALAGYWVAMMLGRLVSAGLLRRIRDAHLVTACGAMAAGATGLLLIAPSFVVGAVAAFLVGLSYSAIYPTTLAMVGDRFPRFAGTVFGVLFSLALIGGMLFPWAAGHLAESLGLRAGLALPLLGAAMIAVLELYFVRQPRT